MKRAINLTAVLLVLAAGRSAKAWPADALANRALLRDTMTRHGFEALSSEWWHYDFRGWEKFELMNVGLEEL